MSSGNSIRAARAVNKHIVALELDTALFDEVLQPLQEGAMRVLEKQSHNDDEDEDEDEELPDEDEVNLCE